MNLVCSRFGTGAVTLFIVMGGMHCHREVGVLTVTTVVIILILVFFKYLLFFILSTVHLGLILGK